MAITIAPIFPSKTYHFFTFAFANNIFTSLPDVEKTGLVHIKKVFYHFHLLHVTVYSNCRSSGQQRKNR